MEVDGVGNGDEVLEEFRGHIFGSGIIAGQLKGDREHCRAVEGHPGSAIGLAQATTARQRLRSIEHADVIQSEKAACKQVSAFDILPVYPPGKIDDQFLKTAGKEKPVPLP